MDKISIHMPSLVYTGPIEFIADTNIRRCCTTVETTPSRKKTIEWGWSKHAIIPREYDQCRNKALVERDGKWYCKLHDPVEIAKRKKVREEKRRLQQKNRVGVTPFGDAGESLRQVIDTLKAENDALRTENSTLKGQLADAEKELELLRGGN
jgi:hypothetical protein